MPQINSAFIAKAMPLLCEFTTLAYEYDVDIPALPQMNHWILQQLGNGATGTATATATAQRAPQNRAIAKTPRIRNRSAAGGTTSKEALAGYFAQHPTANLTLAQLREVSPFKSWRPNTIGRVAAMLVKERKLTKKGDAWSLSNIDRSINTGRTGRKGTAATTGNAAAEAEPIAAQA